MTLGAPTARGEELVDRLELRPVEHSERVFEGMVWDVVRDTVDLGEGGTVRREYIQHPGAVAIVALDDRDRVLFIQQYRHPVGTFEWELPAGLLDVAGEPPWQAAARELHEEADLEAGRWDVLMDYYSSPGGVSEALRIFVARDLSDVPHGDRFTRDGRGAGHAHALGRPRRGPRRRAARSAAQPGRRDRHPHRARRPGPRLVHPATARRLLARAPGVPVGDFRQELARIVSGAAGTALSMKTRNIGNRTVSAIGLGGMPMSIEGRPDRDRSLATIHASLEAGVTFIDTADAYHLHADEVGHNESLIAEALQSWGGDASQVLVATKGGHLRPGDGSWTIDSSPQHLREACEASLKRLGVDAIGLYQLHRPDVSGVPYEESVGAIGELLDEGKIQMAGISNADPEQIRLAQEVLGGRLVSVQNQYSPSYRSSEPELRLCDELGIAFLPWSPLGGISKAGELGSTFAPFQEVADAHGVSPQQVTLAWMLATSPVVIPIPGSSRPETARDSAAAVELELTADELQRLSTTG